MRGHLHRPPSTPGPQMNQNQNCWLTVQNHPAPRRHLRNISQSSLVQVSHPSPPPLLHGRGHIVCVFRPEHMHTFSFQMGTHRQRDTKSHMATTHPDMLRCVCVLSDEITAEGFVKDLLLYYFSVLNFLVMTPIEQPDTNHSTENHVDFRETLPLIWALSASRLRPTPPPHPPPANPTPL